MQDIRIELVGVNTALYDGHSIKGHGGNGCVSYMARHLISLGYDPLSKVFCYRKEMLSISGGTLDSWSKINYVETDEKSVKRKKYTPFKWGTTE